MKKIMIVSGHPDLKVSLANKTILDEISQKLPEAEIRKLDELYPDCKFDIKAEQKALESADIIVFQYPIHWYGAPGILKLYNDRVMEHGWAYGSKGTALKGKAFVASVTAGVPETGYSANGPMKHTLEEYSYGIIQFAETCKLDFKNLCTFGGAMYVPGVTTDEKKAELVARIKEHAGKLIDYLKTL